jgi:hypothetical protein
MENDPTRHSTGSEKLPVVMKTPGITIRSYRGAEDLPSIHHIRVEYHGRA